MVGNIPPCVFLILLSATACNAVSNITFAFALDSTGSMRNEISEVRIGLKKILDMAPAFVKDYAVVLFNDPTVGPSTLSSDVTTIKSFIDNVRVNGGGDCPELAMAGLLKAIELCRPNSLIFFFSDASAKDYTRKDEVLTAARAKSITIYFVLTGCCGDCRSVQFEAYRTVGNGTNGKVYITTESGVKTFMNVLYVAAYNDSMTLWDLPTDFNNYTVTTTTTSIPTTTAIPTTTTTTPGTTPALEDFFSSENELLTCEHYNKFKSFLLDVPGKASRRQFLKENLQKLLERTGTHYDLLPVLFKEYGFYEATLILPPMLSSDKRKGDLSSLSLTDSCVFFHFHRQRNLFLICFERSNGSRVSVAHVYDGSAASISDFPQFKVVRSDAIEQMCDGDKSSANIQVCGSSLVIYLAVMTFLGVSGMREDV